MRYRILLLALALLLAACGTTQGPKAKDAYTATAALDAQNDRLLVITVQEVATGQPANLTGDGLLHTHILPADLSTLYHEHPERVSDGRYTLDLSFLPRAGEYDVWVEITRGNDHAGAFLKRFPVQVKYDGTAPKATTNRLTMEAREFDLKVAEQSHLNFLLRLDGEPVERYATFMNVEVHAFAVSPDRQWLMHDHAHVEKQGMVDAHAHFPHAGPYVVFIQPTALDGKTEVREMLRHKVTIPGN